MTKKIRDMTPAQRERRRKTQKRNRATFRKAHPTRHRQQQRAYRQAHPDRERAREAHRIDRTNMHGHDLKAAAEARTTRKQHSLSIVSLHELKSPRLIIRRGHTITIEHLTTAGPRDPVAATGPPLQPPRSPRDEVILAAVRARYGENADLCEIAEYILHHDGDWPAAPKPREGRPTP